MTCSRALRLCAFCLSCLALPAGAVERIDIHIDSISHPAGEIGEVYATLDTAGRWQGTATVKKGDLATLTQEFPLPVQISRGQVQGTAEFVGEQRSLRRLKASFRVVGAAFSDEAGLHAGDKLAVDGELELRRQMARWDWAGKLRWSAGEVFWQPLYLGQGGLTLQGRGSMTDEAFSLDDMQAALAGVGAAQFAARVARGERRLSALDFSADNLDMGAVYAQLLQPLLEKTMLGNLEMAGRADVRVTMRGSELNAFRVALRDFDVEDKSGRFALYKVSAQVPWSAEAATQASLRYAGGHLLTMPLGAADLAASLNGYSLTAPQLHMPLLDGALELNDVSAAFIGGGWHWHLGASLSPVSMADFSHAVGWPSMQGKMAASIPLVTYTNGNLSTEGAVGLNVFDGSVVVDNLTLQNPLGLAPRLQADIRMRDLDLGQLTETFSFGAITGRLDGDVSHLVLSRWQPVQFDARFRSSAGDYPKKISQRAVENISALGGAGAAAAIQRSFLRFFKEFHYARIGLSCELHNGICRMDGVEPARDGYVIVKGSGIPAITVLGYNRSVGWEELLSRLQRITQGNAAPLIR